MRFLSSNFRSNRWWFGLLLLARGFGFSLVIVVATDTASAQTSLATLILVLYGFCQAMVWPWKAPIINVFDVVLSVLLLLLVNKTKARPQIEIANDDWDFSRVFTFVLLLLIAAALATLVLASLGALLVFYLSPQHNRKKRSTAVINLSKPTSAQAVIHALQQVAAEFSRNERYSYEIEENLAGMNHYDFKAVVNAIHIISSTVLPVGDLPAEMKPSLRVLNSNMSLNWKPSTESLCTQAEQPEPEKMEPATASTISSNDVNGSDPRPVESLQIDPRPNEAQNEVGNGANEAAAGSSNLTELEKEAKEKRGVEVVAQCCTVIQTLAPTHRAKPDKTPVRITLALRSKWFSRFVQGRDSHQGAREDRCHRTLNARTRAVSSDFRAAGWNTEATGHNHSQQFSTLLSKPDSYLDHQSKR
eukprot:s839_g5.t1